MRFAVIVLAACSLLSRALFAYTPLSCSGPQQFDDVPNTHPFCPWITELRREEISLGCSVSPSRYCPDAPVTRAQAAELLGKALHQHVWGEGRPGTFVYGEFALPFDQLCASPVAGVFMGLSRRAVSWDGAAAACPAAYWVCTEAERGTAACDTTRPDTLCDAQDCDGSCVDLNLAQHLGWLADGPASTFRYGSLSSEAGGTAGGADTCSVAPAWCCTR